MQDRFFNIIDVAANSAHADSDWGVLFLLFESLYLMAAEFDDRKHWGSRNLVQPVRVLTTSLLRGQRPTSRWTIRCFQADVFSFKSLIHAVFLSTTWTLIFSLQFSNDFFPGTPVVLRAVCQTLGLRIELCKAKVEADDMGTRPHCFPFAFSRFTMINISLHLVHSDIEYSVAQSRTVPGDIL